MIAFSSEQQNNHKNRRESPGCPSLVFVFHFQKHPPRSQQLGKYDEKYLIQGYTAYYLLQSN